MQATCQLVTATVGSCCFATGQRDCALPATAGQPCILHACATQVLQTGTATCQPRAQSRLAPVPPPFQRNPPALAFPGELTSRDLTADGCCSGIDTGAGLPPADSASPSQPASTGGRVGAAAVEPSAVPVLCTAAGTLCFSAAAAAASTASVRRRSSRATRSMRAASEADGPRGAAWRPATPATLLSTPCECNAGVQRGWGGTRDGMCSGSGQQEPPHATRGAPGADGAVHCTGGEGGRGPTPKQAAYDTALEGGRKRKQRHNPTAHGPGAVGPSRCSSPTP